MLYEIPSSEIGMCVYKVDVYVPVWLGLRYSGLEVLLQPLLCSKNLPSYITIY